MEEKNMKGLEEQKKKKKDADETLPYCATAPSAEQARAFNDDEPCDDGREGIIEEN